MKKATSTIIPADILECIISAFNKKEDRCYRNGCSSFTRDLVRSLNRYINANEARLPVCKARFYNGVSEGIVLRAFNLKGPAGATKALRNLLACYATDGKCDWDGLIKKYFPRHSAFLDVPEKPSLIMSASYVVTTTFCAAGTIILNYL